MVRKLIFTGILFGILNSLVIDEAAGSNASPIDRHALVSRHNVTLNEPNSLTPLSLIR